MLFASVLTPVSSGCGVPAVPADASARRLAGPLDQDGEELRSGQADVPPDAPRDLVRERDGRAEDGEVEEERRRAVRSVTGSARRARCHGRGRGRRRHVDGRGASTVRPHASGRTPSVMTAPRERGLRSRVVSRCRRGGRRDRERRGIGDLRERRARRDQVQCGRAAPPSPGWRPVGSEALESSATDVDARNRHRWQHRAGSRSGRAGSAAP